MEPLWIQVGFSLKKQHLPSCQCLKSVHCLFRALQVSEWKQQLNYFVFAPTVRENVVNRDSAEEKVMTLEKQLLIVIDL